LEAWGLTSGTSGLLWEKVVIFVMSFRTGFAIALGVSALGLLGAAPAEAGTISFTFTPQSVVDLGTIGTQLPGAPFTNNTGGFAISTPGDGDFLGATGITPVSFTYSKTNPPADVVNPGTGFDSIITVQVSAFTLSGSCAACNILLTPALSTTANGVATNVPVPISNFINQNSPEYINVAAGPQSIGLTFNLGTFFTSQGPINFGTLELISPIPAVPYPVPFIGAAAAFGFSRKLRKRISQAKTV
jgi:hypothetical protein